MCVAVPGTVIEIEGKYASVDFGGSLIKARCGLTEIKPGDRVLVHAGYIIQTLSKTEAEEMEEIIGMEREALKNND